MTSTSLSPLNIYEVLDIEKGYTTLQIQKKVEIRWWYVSETTIRKYLKKLEDRGTVYHRLTRYAAWIWFKFK